MYCKLSKSTKYYVALIVVGIVSFIFGVVCEKSIPADSHNLNMLMGMFTGLGAAFAAFGIVKLIHYKRTPVAKLKQEEIELKDERNVQIMRIAYTISSVTASILFAVMGFVFVALGYRIPSFISLGALYVQVLAFFIAYKYFNKKM